MVGHDSDSSNDPQRLFTAPSWEPFDDTKDEEFGIECREDALSRYRPPQGFVWRPVVVDGLNFMAHVHGPDWSQKTFGGTLMAAFASYLHYLGATRVRFVLPRSVTESLLEGGRKPHNMVDRNDFLWLYKNQYIIVAPSWLSINQVAQPVSKEQSRGPPRRKKITKSENYYWKCNDDLVTLHVAALTGAVIMSHDRFKDIKAYLQQQAVMKMLTYLREGQMRYHLIDLDRNLWRLEPMYQCSVYNDSTSPLWQRDVR